LVAPRIFSAPDLRTMLIRTDQATRVLTAAPRIEALLDDVTPRLTVDVHRLDDPEHIVIDTLLAFIHRTIGWAIGRRVPLVFLEMPYETPPFLRYYEAAFGLLPTFGAEVAVLGFDADLLDAPLLRTPVDLEAYIGESPTNFFSIRDHGSTTADQVRRILDEGLTGDWPTPDEIASRLSVSVHHLRRLLREEGTTVSDLRGDLMRDTAINSLVIGKESIDELSARLGFSEPSAFRRAFRRWTGMPPGAYRPR
jgi:AraC-like DNA-binding protein